MDSLELSKVPLHRGPRFFKHLRYERHWVAGLIRQRIQLRLELVEVFSPLRNSVPRTRVKMGILCECCIEVDDAGDAVYVL